MLPTIHMFWHGPPLSRLEQLCIKSFVANGHPVDLYVYEEPKGVPAGVHLKDASDVLPRDLMFTHKRTGSVGLFSDWFRFRLLAARGGVWADTDVVCVKPVSYSDPLIFAWENERYICTAVLGAPAGHELPLWLAACCEDPNKILPYDNLRARVRKLRRRYLQGNRRNRIRWGEYGPKGLTAAVRYFGLDAKALPSYHFYPVSAREWHRIFESDPAETLLHAETHAVHLWHNMMRERPGFDKSAIFPSDSLFERLCARYL